MHSGSTRFVISTQSVLEFWMPFEVFSVDSDFLNAHTEHSGFFTLFNVYLRIPIIGYISSSLSNLQLMHFGESRSFATVCLSGVLLLPHRFRRLNCQLSLTIFPYESSKL